ncbi:hypothetical protein B9Z55_023692 [Caenorhabditis nigoni]|nr:hypothetical protein B9Z55_023692 [Caenorhabditis nigoni]
MDFNIITTPNLQDFPPCLPRIFSFRFNLYSPQMRARQKKFDETDQKAPIWVKIREEMDGRIRIDSEKGEEESTGEVLPISDKEMKKMKMGDRALKSKTPVQEQKKKRTCLKRPLHWHPVNREHTEEKMDVHAGEVGCSSIGDEYQVV